MIFPFNDFKRWHIWFHFVWYFLFLSKGLSPYHQRWYWSAFETGHVPNDLFNPVVSVRIFDRFGSFCELIAWLENLFTSPWKQQHRKQCAQFTQNYINNRMKQNSVHSLIKFNSQLDIKCEVYTVHSTLRGWMPVVSPRSLAIRHFWCEIRLQDDLNLCACQIELVHRMICIWTLWHTERSGWTNGRSSQYSDARIHICFAPKATFILLLIIIILLAAQKTQANKNKMEKRTYEKDKKKRIKTSNHQPSIVITNNNDQRTILVTHLNWLQLNDHTRTMCANLCSASQLAAFTVRSYVFALSSLNRRTLLLIFYRRTWFE